MKYSISPLSQTDLDLLTLLFFGGVGGGWALPIDRLMGCAAGWGRISTAGLTIMGLHFQ